MFLKAHRRRSLAECLQQMCLVPGNKIDGFMTLNSGKSGNAEQKHSADTLTLSSGPGWGGPPIHPSRGGFNFLKGVKLLIPAFFSVGIS